MFTGNFRHTIDDKGRMSIPAKFREVILGSGQPAVMMTTALDPCLVAYPLPAWEAMRVRLRSQAEHEDYPPEMEDFERRFFSSAGECPVDRQGRILIPPHLREEGQLNGEAVLLGIDHKFEIWNPQTWAEKKQRALSQTDAIRKIRFRLGM